MKCILAMTLFFYCMTVPAQDRMEEIRELYKKAPVEESACERLIALLDSFGQDISPVGLGYKGSATMIMAQHVSNPFVKLSYFHKGKSMLQHAIDADRENMELRFLRFAAQTNAPAMLGYRGEIQQDKTLILEALPKSEDPALKKLILGYLKNSDFLDDEEKDTLNTFTSMLFSEESFIQANDQRHKLIIAISKL